MPQFMQGLGDDQRQGETEQAFGGKRLDHRVGKDIPLLQHQNHPPQAQGKHQQAGERVKQPAQRAGQVLQGLLRTQQRDAKEQVVVQPPAPAQPAAGLVLGLEPFKRGRACAQQLVLFKELAEFEDLLDIRFERRAFANLLADLPGRLAPAQQAFELQPADAVKAVDHRVLDHPGRFAVAAVGGFAQAQVFAQGWQGQVSRVKHHQPLHARSVARGRRSK
ncbi:hypothetical protein D3C78_925530 [compost metagenome]